MSGIGHNGGPSLNRGKKGWVAVSRAMREHWLVGFGQPVKPANPDRGALSRAEAWIDLIMECRYEAGTVNNGGRKMEIHPGQLVGAVSYLAHRWNWTPQTVRTWLDKLEDDGMIERAKPGVSESNKQIGKQASVVSICNFDVYQVLEDYTRQAKQQANNTQSTSTQHASNNNNKDNTGTLEQTKKPDAPLPSDEPQRAVGDRAAFINGELVLFNGCRTEWLEAFGDEQQLRLALKQAAGYVQPNNRLKPLEAQVSAQLARMVRDKRDKDDRYAKAAASKAKPPDTPTPPPRKTYTKEELEQIEYWRKRGVTV
ncbi:MAG: hypothetical protein Q7T86_03230 [Hyphomicrobiaceae bacterium]|nr:hypothetical protein [Hyphomicrobiaceae bacterium]